MHKKKKQKQKTVGYLSFGVLHERNIHETNCSFYAIDGNGTDTKTHDLYGRRVCAAHSREKNMWRKSAIIWWRDRENKSFCPCVGLWVRYIYDQRRYVVVICCERFVLLCDSLLHFSVVQTIKKNAYAPVALVCVYVLCDVLADDCNGGQWDEIKRTFRVQSCQRCCSVHFVFGVWSTEIRVKLVHADQKIYRNTNKKKRSPKRREEKEEAAAVVSKEKGSEY